MPARINVLAFPFDRSRSRWVEGKNITIERRYAEGKAESFQEFAAETVRFNYG
jgi:hypothetical protein